MKHFLPISLMGCLTPISLLTDITDTREVSGRMEASNSWTHTDTHMQFYNTHSDFGMLSVRAECDLSVRPSGVPQGPPVRSPLLVGRWSRILQTAELDMSPKHTYVPSEWWSHGASWTCRTCQRPAGEREAGSLLTSQLSVVVVFFTVLSPFDCNQCVLILFLMYSQSMVTPAFKIAKSYINSLQEDLEVRGRGETVWQRGGNTVRDWWRGGADGRPWWPCCWTRWLRWWRWSLWDLLRSDQPLAAQSERQHTVNASRSNSGWNDDHSLIHSLLYKVSLQCGLNSEFMRTKTTNGLHIITKCTVMKKWTTMISSILCF